MKKSNTTLFKFLILFFLLLFFISFCSPISGDDYGCYLSAYGNIFKAINSAKEMYFTWEGRFIGRIIILVFSYHKYLFNIITPLLLCGIFSATIYLMKKVKNNSIYILLMISLLMLNCDMFAQCYTWVAGSVTYLYPSAILLIYFIYIYSKRSKKLTTFDYIIFTIVNFCGTMFVENIGCSLVIGNFLILIYFYKYDKKKCLPFLFFLILSSVSLSIMLLSPGSALRSASNIEFNKLSLLEKIHLNIGNCVKFLFTRNIMMIVLMLIVINYAFRKKNMKIIITILFNIIPIVSIIQNIRNYTPVYIDFFNFSIPSVIDFSRGFYIWYWGIFFIAFLYSIYVILHKDKEKMLFSYFLIFIAIISTAVMMILCVWGDRVTFFSVLTITIVSVMMINEFISQKFYKPIVFIGVFVIIYYIFFFLMIFNVNNKRIEEIYVQVETGQKEIEVLSNPVRYIWNNNIPGEYFQRTYKRYLQLDESVNLNTYRISYKEYIKLTFIP